MSRLFAEQFLVAPLPPDRPEPKLRYDEVRQLNVTSDGRPFVELGSVGRTDTLTEVRSEADDYDRPGDDDGLALGMVTKVLAERDDFAAEALSLGTETRIPGEKEDFADALILGTYTAGEGEPDDDDVQARASEHASSSLQADTKTSIRGEADDFWSDAEDRPLVVPALVRP